MSSDAKHVIDLETAVAQIKMASDDYPQPFFFIIGAGVSHPAVKLASEIEADCKIRVEQAQGNRNSGLDANSSALTRYSYWFEKAFPHPRKRQEYLGGLIKARSISHANLRLAHLLLSKKVGSLVITPNFDDHLSRAVSLFGKDFILCDHPRTVERINPEDKERIQIVHVHGTHHFYDCCNLVPELADRALRDADTTTNMAFLLDQVLTNRSPIVIGYSGWEGDVIMTSLRRRIQGRRLGVKMYWFCFRRDGRESLPDWLDHQDVAFVLPPAPFPESAGSLSAPPTPLKEREREEMALPARAVFDSLIAAFNLPSPPLTVNPFQFFIDQLRETIPADSEESGQDSLYAFHSVISRLQRAKSSELESAPLPPAYAQIEKVRDAMRRSQYKEAVKLMSQIDFDTLEAAQRHEVAEAAWLSGEATPAHSEEETTAFSLVVDYYSRLEKTGELDQKSLTRLAQTLVLQGQRLGESGEREAEVLVYDRVIDRFGKSEYPKVRAHVCWAMLYKGGALDQLNRHQEELTVYDQIVEEFASATETAIRNQVARALVYKAETLGQLDRRDEQMKVYDKIMSDFGGAPELKLRERVAQALLSKGEALRQLDESEEALKAFAEVAQRFGTASELPLRIAIAKALHRKGQTLSRMNRPVDALKCFDQLLQGFAAATERPLVRQIAFALMAKAVTLGSIERIEEELTTYEEIERRLTNTSDLQLQDCLAWAMTNKGVLLRSQRRWQEAVNTYDQIVRLFGAATTSQLLERVAWALICKGDTLAESGKTEEALRAYDEVVAEFANSNNPKLLEDVVWALTAKAASLRRAKRYNEELALYDKIFQQFGSRDQFREPLEEALANYGNTLPAGINEPLEIQEAVRTARKLVRHSQNNK